MNNIDRDNVAHSDTSDVKPGRFNAGVEVSDGAAMSPVARERLMREAAVRTMIMVSGASSPEQQIAVHTSVEKTVS